ncbi:MAG: hypothetical protein NTX61_15430 [Bacteroidetes bacterium]|nr:hypothetical protein [Bacteroidota bacterium]
MAKNNGNTGYVGDNPKGNEGKFRDRIAMWTLIISGVIILTLVVLAWLILFFRNNNGFSSIKDLFGILLPVIGTWVGTVLAFYFSKQNFEAASKSMSDLVGKVTSVDEKLQSMVVSVIMKSRSDFPYETVENEAAFRKKTVHELIKFMEDKKIERLPILEDKSNKFVFLIYRSTLERFLSDMDRKTITLKTPKKNPDLTISDIYDSGWDFFKVIDDLVKKYTFLPLNATVDAARKIMLDNSICQDVFITRTGNKDEAIEGWITNDLIVEKADLFKRSGIKF